MFTRQNIRTKRHPVRVEICRGPYSTIQQMSARYFGEILDIEETSKQRNLHETIIIAHTGIKEQPVLNQTGELYNI